MKRAIILGLLLIGANAMAADDEAALKAQMKKDCAQLFAAGAPCSDLVKGTRKCVRQNADKGGSACVDFEKQHKEFFDAGMKDEIIKK